MKNRKIMIFMAALMCLFVTGVVNTTWVCAKTEQPVIEMRGTDTKIGNYEIILGKYDTLAKTGRPIYVKGKSNVKKKIGYARGGVYYIYNKSIVYVNKSNILCKTNIISKKTKKIIECKDSMIADSFYKEKLVLYSNDSLKIVNVKNNKVEKLVENPSIQSQGFPWAILFDDNKIYYGKEKDGVSSIVQIDTVNKQMKEIPLNKGQSVIKIVKKSSDIYWSTVTSGIAGLESENEEYDIIKTSKSFFDKFQPVVKNARLINVVSNKVIYEYIPDSGKHQCKAIKQYDISSKEDLTLIKTEELPFLPYKLTAEKKGKIINITLISQSDESSPDKVVYQISEEKNKIAAVVLYNQIIPNNYFKAMKNIKKIYFKKAIKKLYKKSFNGMNQDAVIFVRKKDYKKSKKMIRKVNKKVKIRVAV